MPAIAWAVQLQSLYLTSDYGCRHSQFQYNHLVTLLALVAAAAAGWISWRGYTGVAAESPADSISTRRKRFLNAVGIGMSVLFSLLILAQWLPTATGVPCGK